jgi:large subunit ribosomal protein L35
MPKIKTHSGAKKRFKLSKNGKPMRTHASRSPAGGHALANTTSSKKKRTLRGTSVAAKSNTKQIKRLIPYK